MGDLASDAEFTRTRISQAKGPTLKFKGRLLCEVSDDQGEGRWNENQLWETEGGAWIAVHINCCTDTTLDTQHAYVIPPNADQQARIIEAMDAFRWTKLSRNVARAMRWKTELIIA